MVDHNSVGTVAKLYNRATIFYVRAVGNRQKRRHFALVTTIVVNEKHLLANYVSLLKRKGDSHQILYLRKLPRSLLPALQLTCGFILKKESARVYKVKYI